VLRLLGVGSKTKNWVDCNIVCEFDNGEECGPIVLLEVSTDMKVLLDDLVNSF